jgi:hypothetical protein
MISLTYNKVCTAVAKIDALERRIANLETTMTTFRIQSQDPMVEFKCPIVENEVEYREFREHLLDKSNYKAAVSIEFIKENLNYFCDYFTVNLNSRCCLGFITWV